MSDFRAKIVAELDTSKFEKDLNTKLAGKKVTLNNVTFETKGLAANIQKKLDGHQFTLNLTNVKVDNLSKTITGQLKSAGNQAGQDFSQQFIDRINSKIANGGISASIAKVTQQFNQLKTTVNSMGEGGKSTALRDKLASIGEEFKILETLQNDFIRGGMSNEQLVSTYTKFNDTLSKIKNGLTVVSSSTKQFASAIEVVTLQNKMESWLANNTRATKTYGSTIKSYIQTLKNLSAQGNVTEAELQDLANKFKMVDQAAGAAGLKGKTFGDQLKGALSSISKYVSASTLIYAAFNAVKNGVKDVIDLDTALVDLQKTTTATTAELKEFYFESNDIAKQLGATTQEVIQAAADWSRLGYTIKDAETMAKTSSIFASISPGMDIETATDGLVSAMKAFDIEAENALDDIASKVNIIGNTQAVSNSDIVNILTRSSSAMKEANNTLEETIALGTAATEITRDADGVGNALKTKFYQNCLYVQKCA